MVWTAVIWSWHTLTYSIQRVSSFSFSQRLLVLACASVLHVVLGASLYRLVSGETWSCALFKSYGVLFRAPGFAVSNEATLAASVVMNTLFIFGLFVFAVLIGMISDEIKQQVHCPLWNPLPSCRTVCEHANAHQNRTVFTRTVTFLQSTWLDQSTAAPVKHWSNTTYHQPNQANMLLRPC